MRTRRRPIFPLIFLAALLGLVCLLAAAAAWAIWGLPRQAEQDFGPPAAGLSPLERVTLSARLLLARADLLDPLDAGARQVDFTIAMGESVPQIAARLQAEGIIRNGEAFRWYLIYSGLDTGVQAGEYQLSPALNATQVALALQDATPTEVSFSILPGWRAEEIAASLPTSGLKITPESFLELVNDPRGIPLPADWPEVGSLEGFLFPGVYHVRRDISAEELIATFVSRFDEQVTPGLRQALAGQGLDLQKAVSLASLVQREAVVVDEQPMIASVFLNRLADGMKLDSDPTVQYALGYNQKQKTWWTNPLSLDDLQVDSPYNTYVAAGLPPAPICNPGLSALQAVAHPAVTPYYYFRAKCDGSGKHNFARTLDEQMQNACPE